MTIKDLNPTTRCFPRSRRDAFKFDYMSGIEYYKRPPNKNYVVRFLSVIGIITILISMKAI